jgi:hypothetical protein
MASISYAAIGAMLNSNQAKPRLGKCWRTPKGHGAELVLCLENVLRISPPQLRPAELKFRKKEGFALRMKEAAECFRPGSERIALVDVSLNIHGKAAFYAAFPPSVAHAPSRKVEIHYV